MAKIIKYDLFFPNPPAEVWEYITNAELIAQWLMPSNFLPVEGHEFQLKAPAMPEMDFDGIFHCKVLEVTPTTQLSYSWNFGPGDGTLNKSVVSWTLTEKNGGTELSLVHRGFEGETFMAMFDSMSGGWPKHISQILEILNPATNDTAKA
jgi:uncharacterized protein YndB with AHSA1/START domain